MIVHVFGEAESILHEIPNFEENQSWDLKYLSSLEKCTDGERDSFQGILLFTHG